MSELITTISETGLYDGIPDEVYHADPCSVPSLSSSIAKLLVTRSPRHAFLKHPRLNKAKALEVEPTNRKRDIGSVSHKLVLGAGKMVRGLNFGDYKSADARKARDAAKAAGLVPILADDFEKAEAIASVVRGELQGTELDGIFDDGEPEVTIVWQDIGGIWCRSRVDFLPSAVRQGGHVIVPDLKTSSGSAHPEDWQRAGFDIGANIQAAFYERGLKAVIPTIRTVEFRFVVIEQEEPYAASVVGMGGQAMEEARGLVELAMQIWASCTKSGSWPGYSKETTFLDPPVYYARSMEIRRLALLHRISQWQRPLGMQQQPLQIEVTKVA